MTKPTYVQFFSEFGIEDVASVGGKNASLGEMYQKLSDQGVRVPNGFATTAQAYRYMLEESGAVAQLHEALDGLVPSDVKDLARRAKRAARLCTAPRSPKILPPRSSTRITPSRGVRRRREPGRALVGDGGRPAHGELRRSTGDLPQRSREESCSTPASDASPACSPIAPSTTASTRVSTTTRSRCRSAS